MSCSLLSVCTNIYVLFQYNGRDDVGVDQAVSTYLQELRSFAARFPSPSSVVQQVIEGIVPSISPIVIDSDGDETDENIDEEQQPLQQQQQRHEPPRGLVLPRIPLRELPPENLAPSVSRTWSLSPGGVAQGREAPSQLSWLQDSGNEPLSQQQHQRHSSTSGDDDDDDVPPTPRIPRILSHSSRKRRLFPPSHREEDVFAFNGPSSSSSSSYARPTATVTSTEVIIIDLQIVVVVDKHCTQICYHLLKFVA